GEAGAPGKAEATTIRAWRKRSRVMPAGIGEKGPGVWYRLAGVSPSRAGAGWAFHPVARSLGLRRFRWSSDPCVHSRRSRRGRGRRCEVGRLRRNVLEPCAVDHHHLAPVVPDERSRRLLRRSAEADAAERLPVLTLEREGPRSRSQPRGPPLPAP